MSFYMARILSESLTLNNREKTESKRGFGCALLLYSGMRAASQTPGTEEHYRLLATCSLCLLPHFKLDLTFPQHLHRLLSTKFPTKLHHDEHVLLHHPIQLAWKQDKWWEFEGPWQEDILALGSCSVASGEFLHCSVLKPAKAKALPWQPTKSRALLAGVSNRAIPVRITFPRVLLLLLTKHFHMHYLSLIMIMRTRA